MGSVENLTCREGKATTTKRMIESKPGHALIPPGAPGPMKGEKEGDGVGMQESAGGLNHACVCCMHMRMGILGRLYTA
jgi:hypothetical protein